MWFITKENFQSYLLGSTFFATGGGLPPKEHEKMFLDLFEKCQTVSIKQCSEFNSLDILASVYGVGDPSQVSRSFDELVIQAIIKYEQLTGIRIKGIIPGEIGAEALAFQAAACLGLPVLDSDLVGGRAAPEIEMDVFTACNIPITPVLVIDMDGASLFLSEFTRGGEIEKKARTFLAGHSSNGVLIGYSITVREYAQRGMEGTLSRTRSIGEALAKEDTQSAFQLFGAQVRAKEKLVSVDLRSEGGFLKGTLYFEEHSIRVKNEHIILEKNGEVIVRAPDLIIVMDESGLPIHNADIFGYCGKNLVIISIPSQGYWKEEKNRMLWENIL